MMDEQQKHIRIVPALNNNEEAYILQTISYCDDGFYSTFNTRVRNRHPIIIENLSSKWPAKEKWSSISYIQSLFGEEEILVLESKDNKHFFKNELTIHHQMPGNEAVDLILGTNSHENEKKWYARLEFRDEFLKDVFLPYSFTREDAKDEEIKIPSNTFNHPFKQKNCTIWISTKGNITPLHYDLCHGLLCQVYGTKRVTLYHKDDFRSLYPNETTHVNKTASKLIELDEYNAGNKVK